MKMANKRLGLPPSLATSTIFHVRSRMLIRIPTKVRRLPLGASPCGVTCLVIPDQASLWKTPLDHQLFLKHRQSIPVRHKMSNRKFWNSNISAAPYSILLDPQNTIRASAPTAKAKKTPSLRPCSPLSPVLPERAAVAGAADPGINRPRRGRPYPTEMTKPCHRPISAIRFSSFTYISRRSSILH